VDKEMKLVSVGVEEIRKLANDSLKQSVATAREFDKEVPEEKRQLENILKYISSSGDAAGNLVAIFPEIAHSISKNFPALQGLIAEKDRKEVFDIIHNAVLKCSEAFVTNKLGRISRFSTDSAKWLLYYDFYIHCYHDMLRKIVTAPSISKEEVDSILKSKQADRMVFLSDNPDEIANDGNEKLHGRYIKDVIDEKCGDNFFDKVSAAEVKDLITTSVADFQNQTKLEVDQALVEILIFEKLDTIFQEYKKSMGELLLETKGEIQMLQKVDPKKVTRIGDRVFEETASRVPEAVHVLLSIIAHRIIGKIVMNCR
jgi:hypothetical protein